MRGALTVFLLHPFVAWDKTSTSRLHKCNGKPVQVCLKISKSRAQSLERWATGWTIGVLGFDSRRGLGIFLFTTAFRTALVPTQLPIQCVPGALSLGVKRPVRKADYSPPPSAEVKECVELYLHSPSTPSWHGA
jgi:hypothetical protein